MKCKDIIRILEDLAPPELAKDWDNVGLLVGDNEKDIKTIMVALDPTKDVIKQGIDANVDMLITHHPMIFSPMKKITYDNFIGKRIMDLIRHDMVYYAMHTNFDVTIMAEVAIKKLNISNTEILELEDTDSMYGIGRFGNAKNSMTLVQYAHFVKEKFHLDHVRIVGDKEKEVSIIGISPGSGKSLIKSALMNKLDVLITGDIDHHSALDAAEQGLCIIDAGHFGTEYIMVDYMNQYLVDFITNHFSGVDIKIISATEKSPFSIC